MNLRNSFIHRIALVRTSFKLYTEAYLEFEIAGANKQISPVFLVPVNDRKYVFHFRQKPKPKPDKHLALGQIPKPKVQIYVKIGGILLKFNVSND